MIGWLCGSVINKQAPFVVLNVNGIGYEIEMPLSCFYDVPEAAPDAPESRVWCHMVVREDAQLLFGFTTQEQRDIFRSLIKVNGVGPKVGLAILSTLNNVELMQAVSNEDVTQLVRVPGIGKKTAQRLLVELKDKFEKQFGDLDLAAQSSQSSVNADKQDAIAALVSLGYKNTEVSRVISGLDADLTSQEFIRQSLKLLSSKVL